MTRTNRNFAISLFSMAAALVALEIGFSCSDLIEEIARKEDFTAMIKGLARTPVIPDIVAIGDSRIRHGFRAELVERRVAKHTKEKVAVWNLGRGGVMGEVVLALTLRSLEKPRPPKVALLYVDPSTVMPEQKPDLKQLVLTKPWRLKDLPAVVRAGPPVESLLTIVLASTFSTIRYRDWVQEAMNGKIAGKKTASLGNRGFTPFLPRGGRNRHKRAVARARAYGRQYRGSRVGFTLSDFGLGALREAIRQYQAAGTRVVLISSAATEVVSELLRDSRTIGPLFLKTMQRLANEHGIPFLDHSRPPVLSDADFADGDHLNRFGASRYSTWLTHEVILPVGWGVTSPLIRWTPPHPEKGCRILFDFEELSLAGWTVSGSLGPLLAHGSRGMQPVVSKFKGLGLLSTFHERLGYGATGTAVSPPFTIPRPMLRFLVGGGRRNVGVELLVAGTVVRSIGGKGDNRLRSRTWDVSEFVGHEARLRVVDNGKKRLGYVSLDQVEACIAK